MIDLHIHALPGLDDGPRDLAEAVELCRAAATSGTTALVAAGHWREGYYQVEKQALVAAAESLRAALAQAGIVLELHVASDIHWDPRALSLLADGRLATIAGSRYFLLELPEFFSPVNLKTYLFEAGLAGYVPVITHPERNATLRDNPELLAEIAGQGAYFQWTAGSFLGLFGGEAEKASRDALEHGLVHFIASDAHNVTRRPPDLSAARRFVSQRNPEAARRIFDELPALLIANQELSVAAAEEEERAGFDLGL